MEEKKRQVIDNAVIACVSIALFPLFVFCAKLIYEAHSLIVGIALNLLFTVFFVYWFMPLCWVGTAVIVRLLVFGRAK